MAVQKSGRDCTALVAGHMANLINGNDRLDDSLVNVDIDSYRLFGSIIRLLANNKNYRNSLVGYWTFPADIEKEIAAEFYFDNVIDRPVGRKAQKPSSTDNLRAFLLKRSVAPMEVREEGELSTWGAITRGPGKIIRCVERETLYQLSNLILKCLDAANRPYAEILRLGLSPKDWIGTDAEVGVNRLKGTNAFVKALRSRLDATPERRAPNAQELEETWAEVQIPGFKKCENFLQSAFGKAVIQRLSGSDQVRVVSFDELEAFIAAGEDDEELDLMSADEAFLGVEEAAASSVISTEEKLLLTSILNGESLDDVLSSNLAVRRRLKNEFDNDIESWISDLSTRVAEFSAGRIG